MWLFFYLVDPLQKADHTLGFHFFETNFKRQDYMFLETEGVVSSQNSTKKTLYLKRALVKEFRLCQGLRVPMVFQHSRSQALIKEEGCVRLGEPM
jgi:hypothetical protein